MTSPGGDDWVQRIPVEGDYQEFVAGAVPISTTVSRPPICPIRLVDVCHSRGFHRRFDALVDGDAGEDGAVYGLRREDMTWQGMALPGRATVVRLELRWESLRGRARLLFSSAQDNAALWELAGNAHMRIVIRRPLSASSRGAGPLAWDCGPIPDAGALATLLKVFDVPRQTPLAARYVIRPRRPA